MEKTLNLVPKRLVICSWEYLATLLEHPSRAFADSLNTLDTAPNIIRYIEAIKNCLRPGGLFVNVGPLLWHFENNAPGQHGHEKDSASEKSPDRSSDKMDAKGS